MVRGRCNGVPRYGTMYDRYGGLYARAVLCLLNSWWPMVERNLAPRLPFPEQTVVE